MNTTPIKSTLYTREYLIDTSIGDVEILAPTYKEFDTLLTKYPNKPNTLQVKAVQSALLNPSDFDLMSVEDVQTIYKAIVDTSIITNEEIEIITDALHMIKEDSFSAPTFKSCALCQEQNLDKLRNCPLLDKSTHSKDVFYLINNKKLIECPMDNVNNNILVADAVSAFFLYKDKILPMSGGMVDQTSYFYKVAPIAKSILHQPSLGEDN